MGFNSPRNTLNQGKFLLEHESDHLEMLLKRQLDRGEERNALMLLVAMRTGARAGELLAMRKTDFSFQQKQIFIKGSKGSDDREIPLPDWLCKKLNAYITRQLAEPMWNISYARLIQIWYFYRPVQKKFHSLRHTFAIKVYTNTKDIRLVQRALGHRSISNTLIYLDYVHRASEVKKLVW